MRASRACAVVAPYVVSFAVCSCGSSNTAATPTITETMVAVTGGTGSVTGAATSTNPRGIATAGGWILGPGANQLTATVTWPAVQGGPWTASFTATGTP